jgi:hypothetical protein
VDLARDAARAGQVLAAGMERAARARPLTGEQRVDRSGGRRGIERVHVTKQGETPQTVSQLYYGTPDHAVDLLRANKLSWMLPTFAPGMVIVVPSLSQATGTRGV